MRTSTWRAAACLALAWTLALGCQNRQEEADAGEDTAAEQPAREMRITEVQVGHGVTSAHQVGHVSDTFAPGDTIYASVKTEDTRAGTTIVARWVYTEGGEEQVVAEDSQTTGQAGTGYTSFFIANSNPWPSGSYEVRILTDGEVRETKGFTVEGGA